MDSQPCSSRKNPQGIPISLRQRLNVEQWTMSRYHKKNPPRKIPSPHAIITHISLSIRRSLWLLRSCMTFESPLMGPCGRFSGRRSVSITYTARKKTTAVSMAYVAWWKTGSCRNYKVRSKVVESHEQSHWYPVLYRTRVPVQHSRKPNQDQDIRYTILIDLHDSTA